MTEGKRGGAGSLSFARAIVQIGSVMAKQVTLKVIRRFSFVAGSGDNATLNTNTQRFELCFCYLH